jgi:hypothetical protein
MSQGDIENKDYGEDPSSVTWEGEDVQQHYNTGTVQQRDDKRDESCERTGGRKTDCDCSCKTGGAED